MNAGTLAHQSEKENSPNLLDDLLREQGNLTAVERFSQRHQEGTSGLYQDLIPLSRPGKNEQYAFEVDLDACSGCKACVTACHSMNGLSEGESWRDVGSLVSLDEAAPITVTSACHHCADPACANGCPTLAYDKDPETGIVRHLDDQCIGCGYCEMKCPYDVPKYNDALGIVRKCDMCHSRLAVGEAPACVAACPNGAIKIRIVDTEAVPSSGQIVPGAFESSYTKPTTTFKSSRDLSKRMPADSGSEKSPHSHPSLVFMLTLTQLAVGIGISAALLTSHTLAITAATIGMLGMVASVTHLGQPKKAWRAFLGLRKSWLSREIVAFGAWQPPVLAAAVFPIPLFLWGAVAAGILAVICSAMVYVDTRRRSWRASLTFPRFFGTVILGAVTSYFYPPLILPALLISLFERRQFFKSMTVLKMPGN